jgi:hypothetical protein
MNNEFKRMQKLAGLIIESQLNEVVKNNYYNIKHLKSFNESISKKDIDVYRMSLYPDKGKKRGSDEMIDKIGQKLKNNDATKISYTRRSDDGVDVEFSIGDIKYKAIFNHTGTCEKLEKY